MKKRLFTLLLISILCLMSLTPAYAETAQRYVHDEIGILSSEAAEELEEKAEDLFQTYGIKLFYVITDDTEGKSTVAYAEAFYNNLKNAKNSVVLVHDSEESQLFVYVGGRAANLFTEADTDEMWRAYNEKEYYYDGIAAYMDEAAKQMKAKNVEPSTNRQHPSRLVDRANLLSADEEKALVEKLNEISKRQQCDVAIVTVNSLDGKTAEEYADDFYDNNSYGMGEGDDGILFLISMEDRDWAISTYGYGITSFTDAGQEYIMERVQPLLSDGEYAAAFQNFTKLCDEFLTQAKNDEVYDYDNLPKEPLSILWIPASLAIGAVIAFLVTWRMKRKLKSVGIQASASNYEKEDALKLTEQTDSFLYRHVESRKKPKNDNNSKGGSSTHRSSSGRSHGGSSGKF